MTSVKMTSVKTWMEGTNDIPYKNSYFCVTTEPKSDGVFDKMQIISYIVKIGNHISIDS